LIYFWNVLAKQKIEIKLKRIFFWCFARLKERPVGFESCAVISSEGGWGGWMPLA